jgi:hypothetical protein
LNFDQLSRDYTYIFCFGIHCLLNVGKENSSVGTRTAVLGEKNMERFGGSRSAIAKILEDHSRIGAALEQNQQAELFRQRQILFGPALNSILEGHREHEKSIAAAFASGGAALIASQFKFARMENLKILGDFGNKQWIEKTLGQATAAYASAVTSLFSEPGRIRDILYPQADFYKELISRTRGHLTATFQVEEKAASTWSFAAAELLKRIEHASVVAQSSATVETILRGQLAYTGFVKETLNRIENGVSDQMASRLRGSINLASVQLLDFARNFPELGGEIEEEVEGSSSFLEVPFIQQAELLVSAEFKNEDDIENLILSSQTAQTLELSHEVLDLVVICNEAGKNSTLRTDIFKPTNRILWAYSQMPRHLSRNMHDIGLFVDWLFWIFYEGAGKDNLRFQKKCGGPLDDQECDFIWLIKNLRNKWIRHDPDHGSEKEIEKKWGSVADTFLKLGLTQYPHKPQHFEALQRSLLENAKNFLETLSGKLELE